MARIAGVNLPLNKRALVSLTYIHGIGPKFAMDILKANSFKWDSKKKFWWKRVGKEDLENERQWLTKNVYQGYFQGIIEEVALHNKYKL